MVCRRRPRVALLATGAELIPLGAPPRAGAVWDSSRVGLAAQAGDAGARPVAALTVGDDADETLLALEALLDEGEQRPDLVVTAGGVGGGRHDHVRAALARLGVEEVLRGIMADPCRPVWLGRRDDQVVLGLPGNPVSAAVGFHLVGRELLGHREELAPARRPGPRRAEPRRPGRPAALRHPPRRAPRADAPPGVARDHLALRGGRARLDPRARGRPARRDEAVAYAPL